MTDYGIPDRPQLSIIFVYKKPCSSPLLLAAIRCLVISASQDVLPKIMSSRNYRTQCLDVIFCSAHVILFVADDRIQDMTNAAKYSNLPKLPSSSSLPIPCHNFYYRIRMHGLIKHVDVLYFFVYHFGGLEKQVLIKIIPKGVYFTLVKPQCQVL